MIENDLLNVNQHFPTKTSQKQMFRCCSSVQIAMEFTLNPIQTAKIKYSITKCLVFSLLFLKTLEVC